VFERKEASGAGDAGLHLVGDEQRVMAPAQRRRLAQIAVVRHVDALALDRLDDERGDVAGRQRAVERREIVEGQRAAVWQRRLKAGAEHGVAVERGGSVVRP
jgi:hypothetical protein